MQYLLLIYDNEKRWSHGYDKLELEQYRAFGKEFAAAIKGGYAFGRRIPLPRCGCGTARA